MRSQKKSHCSGSDSCMKSSSSDMVNAGRRQACVRAICFGEWWRWDQNCVESLKVDASKLGGEKQTKDCFEWDVQNLTA